MEGQRLNGMSNLEFEKLRLLCPSHSNGTLKRFLKAFLTADKAHEMIVKNDKWRVDFNVNNLNEQDEDIKMEIATRKAVLLCHKDLKGRPILFVRVRNHNAYERDLNKLTKFIVYMLEEACKNCDEDVIDSLCIVFDLLDFGMSNMDYQFVQQLIWLLSHRLSPTTTEKIVFADRKAISQYINPDVLPNDCHLV